MTQTVSVQGLGTIQFPDGTSPADMQKAIEGALAKNGAPMGSKARPTQAQAQPEGSALKGAGEGAMDLGAGAVSAIPSGLAQLVGLVKGTLTPGESADNESQEWGDRTSAFIHNLLTPGQSGELKTDAARSAVNQGGATALNAIPAGLEAARQQMMKTAVVPQLFTDPNDHGPGAAAKMNQRYQDFSAAQDAGGAALTNIGGNLLALKGASSLFGREAAEAPKPVAEGAGGFWKDMGARMRAAREAEAARKPAVDTSGAATDEAVAEHPVDQAINAGYKLQPSEAAYKGAEAPMGDVLEGIINKPALRQQVTQHAQKNTNKLAAADVPSIPDSSELTPEVLAAARKPYNEAYTAVRGIGAVTPDAKLKADASGVGSFDQTKVPEGFGLSDVQQKILDLRDKYANLGKFDSGWALDEIKSLRASSRKNYHASENPDQPEYANYGDLASAQRQMADALENQLERAASANGKPGLVDAYRNARQKLAVINTLEDAIPPGTTDVSAPVLAKMKNSGVPLSGNLDKIADIANNFPRVLADPRRQQKYTPIRFFEGAGGVGLGGAGLWLHNPYLMAGAAVSSLGRVGLRHALLSNLYQKGLLSGAGEGASSAFVDPALARLATGTGFLAPAVGSRH